jgi:sec-independent protein translocase protein TatB
MWDTLLLMVLALVVFGPRRLPMIGRQLGKLMYEFRKASNDFKFQMEEELRAAEEADRRKKEEEERQRALAAAPPQPKLEQAAAESEANAPESTTSATASVASPYPGEGAYPDLAAEGTPSEAAAQSSDESAMHSAAEDSAPRIQPPSTGETVAAERPGPQPQQRELFEGDSSPIAESITPEAERSEPAAHHG